MASTFTDRFKNKIVVVTGASAGIGRAVSIAFAQEGANLALISRNKERLQTLQQEINSFGVQSLVLALDVAESNKVEEAAFRIENELGPIDIWVNNAMVSVFSPIKEMKPEEYKRVTEVTYLGVVYGTLSALKFMLPRNKGLILQVGSALAYRGIPLQSAYCAAKHAIQGFHDSLLTELLHDKSNVKTTMVQLSAHNTPQFNWARSKMPLKAQPVPPIYQPELAAEAILWAALHYKREYIVGFPSWKAIRGNSLFPNLADRFLAKNGYKSQQTNEVKEADPMDNLINSVDAPFGSHGRFDKISKRNSLFFQVTKYRTGLFLPLLILLIILMIIIILV